MPAADVATPEEHQVRVGSAAGRVPAQHEHRAERIRRRRGERLGRQAVERQPQLGHEARVTEEQALRMLGVDLARTARDAERRALDESHDAVGAAQRRARARRPRLRHSVTLAVPHAGISLPTMRVAVVAPVWFAVPPTGYGGIELVVSLLADGLVDAGHDVTLFASGGSRTKAALVSPMAEPPDPRELGNPWYDGYHALASYLQVSGFDIVHDHAGIVGPICGALITAAHRSCTRCTDRGPSTTARSTR